MIGKDRRRRVQDTMGLHFNRAYGVFYGNIEPYEPQVSRVVRNIFKQNGRVFVDVGAYFGYYVQMVDKLTTDARIVAVEPDPQNFQELLTRLPKTDVVRAFRMALWKSDDEEVEFNLGAGNLSISGSLTPTEWHRRNGFLSGKTIKVKTIRLDTLVKMLGLDVVDLVKIDIEGAEYPVLTDPTLDLSAVKNLIVEIHYSPLSEESIEIHRCLKKKGYSIFALPSVLGGRIFHLVATKSEISW
ncbi:MAG: FkbM family methyltransferase [Candidatus Caldarchaeum sp.]